MTVHCARTVTGEIPVSNDMMLLNLCKHFHYPILLSSDSHGTEHIGDFSHAMELIRLAEFPEELILNRSSGEFLSWLEKWL